MQNFRDSFHCAMIFQPVDMHTTIIHGWWESIIGSVIIMGHSVTCYAVDTLEVLVVDIKVVYMSEAQLYTFFNCFQT